MEELVRIESNVAEAAEAAADAASHAVEATKAAEAASVARVAKKAKSAATAKAALAAKTAKTKAGKAARAAKDASEETVADAALPTGSGKPRQRLRHVLDVRLTGDELKQIERLAAEKDISAAALARSLLVRALEGPDEDDRR